MERVCSTRRCGLHTVEQAPHVERARVRVPDLLKMRCRNSGKSSAARTHKGEPSRGFCGGAREPVSRLRREMSGSDGGGGGGGDVFDDSSDGGLGFESSGLDSDEEEFVGCDSRSASGGESGGEEDGSDADERDDAPAATEAEAGDTSDDESVIQCAFQILDKLTTAEETLTCDGGCQREMPPSERRYSCTEEDCDFDICTGCAGRRRQLPVAIRAAPADPPRAQPAAAVPRPAPPPAAPRSSAAAQAARPDGIAALVRDAAARAEAARAARAAHGNGEQRRRMDSYHQWQHERAAERERAAAAQRERAAEAASGSAGEEPIATAASAAGASAATADAAASEN